jgi:S1-C subfamily serine protease
VIGWVALGAALAIGAGTIGFLIADDPQAAAAPTTTVATEAPIASVTPPASTPTMLGGAGAVDAAAIGDAVIPSIVTVEVGTETVGGFAKAGSGSGVILDDSGNIVTNDHVATAGGAIRVVTSDGRIYSATLVGTDPVTDLAVVQVDAAGLAPIEIGSSDTLRVGAPTIAVGNPLGLEGGPSLTLGVLSAFGREVQTDATTTLYGMLQTDAPITQGSSGGALVDVDGRLIGITTAVGVSSIGVEGIGFATPIEIVTRVVADLIEFGRSRNALVGITGATEFAEAADGAQVAVGVRVATVSPGSPAADSGIAGGDLITSIGDYSVDTMDELISYLRRYRAGDTVALSISGTTDTVTVVLGEL